MKAQNRAQTRAIAATPANMFAYKSQRSSFSLMDWIDDLVLQLIDVKAAANSRLREGR